MQYQKFELENASYYGRGTLLERQPDGDFVDMLKRCGFHAEDQKQGGIVLNHMIPQHGYAFTVHYIGSTNSRHEGVGICALVRTTESTGVEEIIDGGVAQDWSGDSIRCHGELGGWNFHVNKNT